MTPQELLGELEALGTAQNRKIYRRHGVSGAQFGVSYKHLGELRKRVKRDHELARALWASGNHDARVLATMIADPGRCDPELLAGWAGDLGDYVLTDALVKLAGATDHAAELSARWRDAGPEWLERAGWGLVAVLAGRADADEDELRGFLARIEAEIHGRQNRVRDAMNSALIAIGARGGALAEEALAAAERIGPVEVDHGETGCTTPAAGPYIRKTLAHRAKRDAARAAKAAAKAAAKEAAGAAGRAEA